MKDRLTAFQQYILEAQTIHLENIREGNPHAFTRKRKTNAYELILQMFAQKVKTQFSELLNFYTNQGKPLDISNVGILQGTHELQSRRCSLDDDGLSVPGV